VARDTKYRTLGEPPRPYIYRPVLQSYDPKMALIVRTTGEPGSVAPAVREQIRTLDPNLPITGIKTLQEQLDLSLFPSRVVAWTLGGFGVLALLLAALGIYGIVSYSVAQRTREIGVRVALGAKQKDVLRLVLGEGLFVIGVGLGVGLLLAAALTRVIAGFLFGIGATDPLTFAAVALVLGLIALAASFIPARRATKVDPWVALRYE
jgi:ABC-type antimicrobial peptide transport system permease subunit